MNKVNTIENLDGMSNLSFLQESRCSFSIHLSRTLTTSLRKYNYDPDGWKLSSSNKQSDFCTVLYLGISPQSCTETDFEMKTSNFVLFLLISVVSVHFRAIYDETIRCQA